MRRPRGGAALTPPEQPPTQPPAQPQAPLPQAWVPRVVNAALALFLLTFITPVLTTFGDRTVLVRVFLVLAIVPVLLIAGLCLASALRPGSLGRAARRRRPRP